MATVNPGLVVGLSAAAVGLVGLVIGLASSSTPAPAASKPAPKPEPNPPGPGPKPGPPPPPPPSAGGDVKAGDKILAIGDSTLEGLQTPLGNAAFADKVLLSTQAQKSTTVHQWSQKPFQPADITGNKIVLIALGSNDQALLDWANVGYDALELLKRVGGPGTPPARRIWLIPPILAGKSLNKEQQDVLAMILSAVGAAGGSPEDVWFPPDGLEMQPGDPIHPTPKGYKAWADAIYQRLRQPAAPSAASSAVGRGGGGGGHGGGHGGHGGGGHGGHGGGAHPRGRLFARGAWLPDWAWFVPIDSPLACFYVVRPGETWESVASLYGLSLASLGALNPAGPPVLRPGIQIRVPCVLPGI